MVKQMVTHIHKMTPDIIWIERIKYETSVNLKDDLVREQPELKRVSGVSLFYLRYHVMDVKDDESVMQLTHHDVLIWGVQPRTCLQYLMGTEYMLHIRFTNTFEIFLLFWIRQRLPTKSVISNIYRFLL